MNQNTIHNIIDNLSQFCRATKVPCISPNTELFLSDILKIQKPKNILEIGTAYGYSLAFMANIIHEWGGSIIGCERAYPNRVEIRKLISLCGLYGLNNISCHYGPFLKIHPSLRNQNIFDFVFIDAQKAEYSDYLSYLIYHKLIDDRTTLLFDDVIKYQERMTDLEQNLIAQGYLVRTHKLDTDDGIIIATKKV